MKYAFLALLLAGALTGTKLSAQASKGQEFHEGWMKTRKGETLNGQICYNNTRTGEIYEKIFFMESTGAKKRFGGDKISSFGCDGKVFDFVQLPYDGAPPPMLMQKVIEGDIILYKAWFKTELSTPQKFDYEVYFFLTKKDQENFVEIAEKTNDKNFRKSMKELFQGDKQILDLIKENNWTVKDLDKIVTAYNDLE